MTRRIRLATSDGLAHYVRAEILGPFGIHQNHEPIVPVSKAWIVTHVQSGFRAGAFMTRATAYTYASELLTFPVDWNDYLPDPPRAVVAQINELNRRLSQFEQAAFAEPKGGPYAS